MDSQYKSPAAALVESVEKLQLTDGDILLCRVPANIKGDQLNQIHSVLSMLPKTVRIMIVANDFDLSKLDEARMAESGWVRATKQSDAAA